ncbi:MAG: HAD-IA family hydrolase [Pseudomonadota bacterium]
MNLQPSQVQAVLFDLDGTLVDSAPDLIGALNRLRTSLGMPETDPKPLWPVAGRGAAAILKAGIPELSEQERAAFQASFLDDYQSHCWRDSRVFEGIPALLDALDQSNRPWGVVTNKLNRLAQPVVQHADWGERASCLIAGDSTHNPKPAPDPVVLACRTLQIPADRVLFVGDDARDIEAGRAAGCFTAAAHWGYIAASDSALDWPADVHFERATDVLKWLNSV